MRVQQRGLTLQVAQPMIVRDRLAARAALRTLLPFVVALPLIGLLIWRLVGHELAPLERTHDPSRIPLVVEWAREAGLQVSLDLIYGTPRESLADWGESLDQALAQEPDHLSAYALIVEDGTKLAAQIRRGEVAEPDDDLEADMYELADRRLSASGYEWYEVSNWALAGGTDGLDRRSRHNLAYWRQAELPGRRRRRGEHGDLGIDAAPVAGERIRGAAPIVLGGDVSIAQLEVGHIARVSARAPSLEAAARVLGIDPTTLQRTRKRYGLT